MSVASLLERWNNEEQSASLMYTNTYVYKPSGITMSGKLYWRIKKNGKWTWTPAIYDMLNDRYEEIKGCEILLWWPEEGEINPKETQ